ncbi:F-box protein At5g67140 isoform X2 [Cryptomeria japonica]|uniref:F-box protein At5g67140 isoform X2 n=1 Tax=Cryptomeria japonica TaxID=3369 RepID=UPI0027DAA215|nr:F-box protein At5g67140 isoform X2 [Cryptomeria japonica]
MGDRESFSPVDGLSVDVLANCFMLLFSFEDWARVCRKWREAMKQSIAQREKLSFAGWKMDDISIGRLVEGAYSLKELDISRACWGCQITDDGLYKISFTKCCSKLTSVSMWGMTGITDKGVLQLVSRASSLQHLNIGGTFISDESLFAIASHCPHLKVLILWSCRHVTERGLFAVIRGCPKLKSINIWGMSISSRCCKDLLTINPHLQIKPGGIHIQLTQGLI